MKRRGYTAPVLVAALVVLYYAGMALLFLMIPEMYWWAKVLLCVIPAGICALIIAVAIQRVREIKSGETDDLDKY